MAGPTVGQRCKLLLGTHNKAKVREIKDLMKGASFAITSLAEEGISVAVEETGKTFEENASIKARAYAVASGLVALADDSGLEVDALGAAPGPLSARYAGGGVPYEEHITLLLHNLSSVPWERRTARFISVVAVATPSGQVEYSHGQCEGVIAFEPVGHGGFGYDPVFFIPQLGKTMAQLTLEEKNRLSHRSRAIRQAVPVVERLLAGCERM